MLRKLAIAVRMAFAQSLAGVCGIVVLARPSVTDTDRGRRVWLIVYSGRRRLQIARASSFFPD
jgi:hypothetical protein